MSQVDTFEKQLKKHNKRVTRERLALFTALATHDSPLSLSKLAELCAGVMDEATVYRNIELFEQLGITHRVHTGWKFKVELSDRYSPHHHHMTCTKCGNVIAFDEPHEFIEALKVISNQEKFQLTHHSLELRGLCSDCCA